MHAKERQTLASLYTLPPLPPPVVSPSSSVSILTRTYIYIYTHVKMSVCIYLHSLYMYTYIYIYTCLFDCVCLLLLPQIELMSKSKRVFFLTLLLRRNLRLKWLFCFQRRSEQRVCLFSLAPRRAHHRASNCNACTLHGAVIRGIYIYIYV